MTLALTRDGLFLFATRIARMFGYGFLSVVLALYLAGLGLGGKTIGLLFSLTMMGDVVISLLITTTADRIGRRRMLILGAVLMFFAGVVFAFTGNLLLLIIAAILGIISPSGNEVGPFLPIEQAALAQTCADHRHTGVFAWYNLAGSFATAFGALAAGGISGTLQRTGSTPLESYRAVVLGYAAIGGLLAFLFTRLSRAIETTGAPVHLPWTHLGLHKSRGIVLKLSALFGLDAFAGGFVVQSFVAYWFHVRFGVGTATLGAIFFGANLLAGVSALAAAWVARRIGLVNTMVFTHLPSNILLILVPLMPDLRLAIIMLLVRFSISQMDVPTRQAYTMAMVAPDERSAAGGVTGIARSVGTSLSPALAGFCLGIPALMAVPFFVAGGLKVIYDVLLYRRFSAVRPVSASTVPAKALS